MLDPSLDEVEAGAAVSWAERAKGKSKGAAIAREEEQASAARESRTSFAEDAAGAESGPSRVSRADYSSILLHEENHVKASAVRAESEQRRDEMRQQRERFRARGQMLKAQRDAGKAQVKSSLEGCHAEALRMGNESREHKERLKQKRQERQAEYELRGKELHAKHEKLRERLKASAEENRAERSREAQQLSATLKGLNEKMEASILAGNAQRVAKVKLETSHRVIRASKQTFADDRWMEADALRSSLSRLRERQRRQEQEYLDAAHLIKASVKADHSDEASVRLRADREATAMATRRMEKLLEDELKAKRDAEIARKRSLHEAMEQAKLVPDDELLKGEETDAGPLAMFTRFFGFRKRGSGHQLSSVAL